MRASAGELELVSVVGEDDFQLVHILATFFDTFYIALEFRE